MKKKIWIFLIILAVAAGGFFYWLWTWQPEKPDFSIGEPSEAPTLFSKEDYKIEERPEGKFIVVEKVGLTCKVPEDWKIEFEGSDVPEPEYWVELYSPDVEFKSMKTILQKGCGISIKTGIAEERVKEIKENIKFLQEYPERSEELKEEYILFEEFEVMKISDYQALKLISSENPVMGQSISMSTPIGDGKLITLSVRFPLEHKGKCSPIWEEFLENVVIE